MSKGQGLKANVQRRMSFAFISKTTEKGKSYKFFEKNRTISFTTSPVFFFVLDADTLSPDFP